MAGMPPIPPLNLNNNSRAESGSGDPFQTGAWSSDGFTVNINSPGASGAAGAIPLWVWVAGALGGLWLWKRSK